MKRARLPMGGVVLVIAVVAAIIVATSGGSARASRSVASNSALSLRPTPVGNTLADANGRTRYLFEGDAPNRSTLSAAGQAVWPPFTSSAQPQALKGAIARNVGTIKQGGSLQITNKGHPLYYYVGDRNPGQTNGQGLNQFGARWYVLAGNGQAVTSAPRAVASAPMNNGASSGSGSTCERTANHQAGSGQIDGTIWPERASLQDAVIEQEPSCPRSRSRAREHVVVRLASGGEATCLRL